MAIPEAYQINEKPRGFKKLKATLLAALGVGTAAMGVAVMNRESKPVAAPMPDTKPLPADNLKPISSETRTYEIVPGDGFFLIAKKVYPNYVHRVSEASLDLMYAAEEIAKANGMTL